MNNSIFLTLLINVLLIALTITAPVSRDDSFCGGNGLVKFDSDTTYVYSYKTTTQLWINDVSQESKSSVDFATEVRIRRIRDCTFQLRLVDPQVTGETVEPNDEHIGHLSGLPAFFRLNGNGELDDEVEFSNDDCNWSKNIKRGIISAFQTRSGETLRRFQGENTKRSALVYEYDVLGRCRTTYAGDDSVDTKSFKLTKSKSLHSCSLNQTVKTSSIQFVPYRNLPEFYQGRLFVEDYDSEIDVKDNVIQKVNIKVKSTYKIGARGEKGAQAVVESNLNFKSSTKVQDRMALGNENLSTSRIVYDFSDKSVQDLDLQNFDSNKYLNDICANIDTGLTNEHASNFRKLIKSSRSKSASDLLAGYATASGKCEIAGITYAQSLLFVDTESSFEAVLSLMDKDAFSSQLYITEYPILTFLTRTQNPSVTLINKLKDYISKKNQDFPYLRKLYLVYSAIVDNYCGKNKCDANFLNDYSSIFVDNLGSNCADSKKPQLVTSSLKAIGNIGSLKDSSVLLKCADNQANSLEVRINAIQALRQFSCPAYSKGLLDLLLDLDEDSEVRINAFLILVKCTETEEFEANAAKRLTEFFEQEDDLQVLTFIVDYAKEHGLTSLLNPILANPKIKERFSVNFKELSWNNYLYRYSVLRDGAYELETSVIYANKSFIPRSVRFNVTLHLFGMSINFLDVNVRIQGLSDVLKAVFIDKLTSEEFLKKIVENPEKLIDTLKVLADKLKFQTEKPTLSLSLRAYGSDVFYSELDEIKELQRLASFIKNIRENLLYKQIKTIRNLFLFDVRVRHPLANGFEFNSLFDISGGLLVSKQSSKTDNGDVRDFLIKNLYSLSGSVNKRLEILIDPKNKLSIKKAVFINAGLNLNVEGNKKKGAATYKITLPNKQEKTLLTIDARFYKLTKGKQYKEINDFTVEQFKFNECTSSKFQNAFGVNFCLNIKRPALGSFKEIIKTLDLSNSYQPFDDDDNDDDDNDNDDENDEYFKRPKLVLSGPYHYDLILKNPDLINKVVFQFALEREEEEADLKGAVKTETGGYLQDRLELHYTRVRKDTNRGLERKIDLELRIPSTNDVRFKLTGEIVYTKAEVLNFHVKLDNKILREADFELTVKREKKEGNAIGEYKLEAIVNSQIRQPRHYKILLDVLPEGKNIKSNLIIEKKDDSTDQENIKIIDGILSATHSDSDKEVDYDVDLQIETFTKKSFHVYGHIAASLFSSNIDVTLESTNSKLTQPVSVKAGHSFDGSSQTKSYVELGLKAPQANVDHHFKVLFQVEIPKIKFNSLEFQIKTPKTGDLPYSIYIERASSENQREYKVGLRNFQIDLSQRTSSLAKTLVKIDNNPILSSLTLQLTIITDSKKATYENVLVINKNDKQFVRLNTNTNGYLSELRKNLNNGEFPKQELGLSIKLKALENTGGLNTKLVLESSAKKRSLTFDFDSDNIFRLLIKISNIKLRISSDGSVISSEYSIVRLGDVRSLSIKSTNGGKLRANANGEKEFDVAYEKVLANGNSLKSNGVVKYTFTDFKNAALHVDVKNSFNFKLTAKNSRNADMSLGNHQLDVSIAHLDNAPFAREFSVLVKNQTDAVRTFTANILIKEGSPNLNDASAISYLVDIKTNNRFDFPNGQRRHVGGENSLNLKVKGKVDIEIKQERDANVNNIVHDINLSAKFPAFISDASKPNFLKKSFSYKKDLKTQVSTAKFVAETDNKFLGTVFKKLTLNYDRKVVNDLGHVTVNVDFNNLESEANKNINLKGQSDCFTGKCKVLNVAFKQNILPSYSSKFADKTFDITECAYERTYERVKDEKKYLLDTTVLAKCKNVVLLKASTRIKREDGDDDLPATNLLVEIKSDVYGFSRRFEVDHKKFSSQNGLLLIGLENGNSIRFSSKISYTRKVDPATSKLISGEYIWTTSTDSNSNKVCTLKIEAKETYYNTLNCRLNAAGLPEITYGYALKVNDVKQFLFGKRSVELNINVPRRTLKFDYNGYYSTPFDKNDDDDDENNEREFNGTLRYFYDFSNDQSKVVVVNLKRDNFDKGSSKTTVDILVNGPTLNSVNFEIKRFRRINETRFNAALGYNLKNGKSNKLNLEAAFKSDLSTNSFSIEESLQRPAFNLLYKSKFNKHNGKLFLSSLRAGKLLKFTVERDYDPTTRKISLELQSPSDKYTVDTVRSNDDGVYTVTSTLKEGGNILSKSVSKFDSLDNQFTWDLDALKTGKKYNFKFAIYNESAAVANLLRGNEELAQATLQVAKLENYNNLVLNLKWNRVWKSIQEDALGGAQIGLNENEKANSYFGDLYGVLKDDLKPSIDNIRETRKAVQEDIKNLGRLLARYYLSALPSQKDGIIAALASSQEEENEKSEEIPLYKRVFQRYNKIAKRLTEVSLALRKYSKRISTYVPRLPVYEYNPPQLDRSIRPFDNNLQISRPTLYSNNLYQFYAEERNYVKGLGDSVLNIKTGLLRESNTLRVKSLINKYKFRSLKDYTIVGHIYNKRNIISFNGQGKILKSKCRYLLAHELRFNQFSVILNNQDNANSLLTVAAGKQLIDISYDKATLNGKATALPLRLDDQKITVTKTPNGICVKVSKDLKVCCHEDSKSCSVALTRWYTGRVNGLLGSSNYANENFDEEYWYADSTCKPVSLQLKKPSDEAIKSCYSIFGETRKAFFSTSFSAVNPDGWRSICEHVLSNDPKGKCPLMRAFVYHAKIKSVEVDEPNECYSCNSNEKKFNIGEKIPKDQSKNLFKNGTDYVFLVLPCEKKFSLENLGKIAKKLQSKNNRQFIIDVDEDSSIYQASSSETLNTDISKAFETLSNTKSSKLEKKSFYDALYLSIHLFSQRLAQQRRLVIVSCGNCLPYSSLQTLKLVKILNKRNIVVSSWGSYDIQDKNNEEGDESEIPIGYNNENVFLYKSDTKEVDSDSIDAYKLEHTGDLCHRLAVKTGGNVFDINHIKEADKLQQVLKKLDENKKTHQTVVKKCERIDTPYGDLDDFLVSKKQ